MLRRKKQIKAVLMMSAISVVNVAPFCRLSSHPAAAICRMVVEI